MPMANLVGDPFAIATVLLAFAAWVVALVPNILITVKHESHLAIPNFAWYAIAFMFCVIVGVTLIFATESATMRSKNYAIAIVGFLVNSLILNALAVNNLIYRNELKTQISGAGFIVLSAVDAIWIFYFGSAPSSPLRIAIDGKPDTEVKRRSEKARRSYDSEASSVDPADSEESDQSQPHSQSHSPTRPQFQPQTQPQTQVQAQAKAQPQGQGQSRPYDSESAQISSISLTDRTSSGYGILDHYTRHSDSMLSSAAARGGAGAGGGIAGPGLANEKTGANQTTREVMPVTSDGNNFSHPAVHSSSVYPESKISLAAVEPLPGNHAQRIQQIQKQQQQQQQQQRPGEPSGHNKNDGIRNENNNDKSLRSSDGSSSHITTWSYLGDKLNSVIDFNRYTTALNSLDSHLSPQRPAPKEGVAGGGGGGGGGDNLHAKALWAYSANAEDPQELSFAQGEQFEVVDKTSVWWKVRRTRNDQEGIAPSNYLSIIST